MDLEFLVIEANLIIRNQSLGVNCLYSAITAQMIDFCFQTAKQSLLSNTQIKSCGDDENLGNDFGENNGIRIQRT